MSGSRPLLTPPSLTCQDVDELAGVYVLGALEDVERDAMAEHLRTCRRPHTELRELGSVVPALASMAEPIDAPAGLKARVMAAVTREAEGAPQPVVRVTPIAPADALSRTPARAAWRVPSWLSWAGAAAAIVVAAVIGVWGLGLQSRVDEVNRRAAQLTDAIAAFSASGSSVALIRPTGAEPAAGSGFAAITATGDAHLVVVGLPSAPSGQTYQAWYIANDRPVSAGLIVVDDDGYAILPTGRAPPGTEVIALTTEPGGGSEQPTSDPFAVGELRPI